RHFDADAFQAESQKPEILQQVTAGWQRIGSRVCNALIMHAARMRRAEKRNAEVLLHQHDVLHRMAFFLAARMAFLLSRVCGTLDAPFGAIMAKRGGLSWLWASYPCASVSTMLWSNRCAKCSIERAGPSPSRRSVVWM